MPSGAYFLSKVSKTDDKDKYDINCPEDSSSDWIKSIKLDTFDMTRMYSVNDLVVTSSNGFGLFLCVVVWRSISVVDLV